MTTLINEQTEAVQHQALYRKYRPIGFDGLIGQNHVKTTLENAIKQGTVSHAYLFTGPRGTGKTSTAKLFAKALNCEKPNGINPCGTCHSCSNESTDIIELDAASNNGVDDIRQLRENIILAPMYGRYKIYILDEIHMLSTQAFNAFLKTLEEPPAHAIFILATTEVHKLPATILSRCQRFDFRRIANEDIIQRLSFVLESEKRTAEQTALNLIAQVSAGGMRDALSLLDQALSCKDNTEDVVTLSDVLTLTGSVDVRVIGQLISLIAEKKIEPALAHFNECFESGKEPKFFIEEMMIYLRDILVFKKLGPTATLKKANTDENFQSVAGLVEVEKIYVYLDELQQTLERAKYHHDLQLLTEMTIIRMVNGEQALLQEQINQLRQMISSGVAVVNVPEASEPEIEPTQAEVPDYSPSQVDVDDFAPSQVDVDEFVPSQVEVDEFVPSQVDVDEFVPSQVDVDEFVPSQVDVDEFTPSQVEVPGYEPPQVNSEVAINDPIGFLTEAVESHSNGIDWSNQIPSEVAVIEETSQLPSEEPSVYEAPKLPTENVQTQESLDGELQNNVDGQEEPTILTTNTILSEKEQAVLAVLAVATKDHRAIIERLRESIDTELGTLNISSRRIFGDFSLKAASEETIIITHANKIQVTLIEKVLHRKNIGDAFENIFKPIKFIAITEEEWQTVTSAFKQNRQG